MPSAPQSTPHRHKETVRRLFREVWTNADFTNIEELIAPQLTYNLRGNAFAQVPENLTQIVKRWKTAFPDLTFEVLEVIAEGDLAAARLVYRGTHQAEWKGMPATGRAVEVHEMMFFRFQNEQIAEVWEVVDEHALRQQLAGND